MKGTIPTYATILQLAQGTTVHQQKTTCAHQIKFLITRPRPTKGSIPINAHM